MSRKRIRPIYNSAFSFYIKEGNWHERFNEAVYRNKKKLKESKVGATEKDISMINDINYALEWMRTAKQPGKSRFAYKREKPCDQRYIRITEIPVYEGNRIQLEDVLSTLTERKIGICVMYRGYRFT
ncbi:RNA polymerase sigma-70 factor, ECF subfamily [Bacillus sp. ok061]|nr:RNA polymerase sigma-70 factor, ECF subfamily [Bacillus sp. ok061]